MIRLSPPQLNGKLQFIQDYIRAHNAADGSRLDANANVTQKNIATMETELMKDFVVQINRTLVSRKIAEVFDQETADEYLRQIEAHEIYVHDETSLKPYCVSVTLYPFLLDGLTRLGGESKAAGPPSIWRPPWLVTQIPEAPAASERSTSSRHCGPLT